MAINIQLLDQNSLSIVQEIAYKTWPIAYGNILSQEQIDYMLNQFYSIPSLQNKMLSNAQFYLFSYNEEPVAFIEIKPYEIDALKLEKLYVLPNQQGKQIGKLCIDFFIEQGKIKKAKQLFLNVNRNNSALHFYTKCGFKISHEEIIPIGNGYVMDDFVMEYFI